MGGWTKYAKGIKKYKLPVIMLSSYRDTLHNIGNTVKSIVITLYEDR